MVMHLVNPNRRHFEIWSEPGGSDKGGNERKRCDYICTKLNKPEFEYYVKLKKLSRLVPQPSSWNQSRLIQMFLPVTTAKHSLFTQT